MSNAPTRFNRSLSDYAPKVCPNAEQRRLLCIELSTTDEIVNLIRQWLASDAARDIADPKLGELLPFMHSLVQYHAIEHPLIVRLRESTVPFVARAAQQRRFRTQLLSALIAHGLTPVLLKGSAMVQDYYLNESDRIMSDGDIYVPRIQQREAFEVLRGIGWRAVSGKEFTLNGELEHAAPFAHPTFGHCSIDLHVHFLSKCPAAAIDAWFYQHTESIVHEGCSVLRLNPTALLTHTVLHAMRWEHNNSMRWIVDASRIIVNRGNQIDWQSMLAFARSNQLQLRLALALIYLHDEFGLPIPDDTIAHLKQHRNSLFERFECRQWLQRPWHEERGVRALYKLSYFILWRAMRLRGGWYVPLDVIRVCNHMRGSDGLMSVARRLRRFTG